MDTKTGLLAKVSKRRLMIIPPLLIGVAAIVLAPMIKSKPQKMVVAERVTQVRTMRVPSLAVVPHAVGYGTVKPLRTWEAVAEVAGQVVWISDDLKNGRTIKTGAEMLRIEDVNYRLALAQINAQLNAAIVKDKVTETNLKIAQKDLKILQSDYKRKKDLLAKGAVSKASAEASQRQMLNGQTQVQNQKNAVELNSVERQVLVAQKESAELDLKRTHMIAPFDVRITDVKIGEAQYANKGQLLFAADGIQIAEVEAQFPMGMLRPLMIGQESKSLSSVLDLHAKVRLNTSSLNVSWTARIDRVSGVIDPQTQSLGVVVSIFRPTSQAQPGKRPPLYRNTFVEVELRSNPLANQIVVPLSTIRKGKVYVVDGDDRLVIKAVDVAFSQGGYAVLKSGVQAGDQIVTSDMVSAIQGMLLAPTQDDQIKNRMIVEATGEEPRL
ncbi:MAG: hypothetical protein COB46_12655 [Rhodospirillaceae bacterium]|nr:MAG: hypothetical protein COB46_12655 [Rhodospirillaceae bacterium]